MSFAHHLMDAGLWFIAVLWVIQFFAHGPKYRARNRRLPPPSTQCERTGDFEVRMHESVLTRRQAN